MCGGGLKKKTGRAGEVPPDAYIGEQRRQAYANLEEAMKKRNGGWSRLSAKLVGVVAVLKRAKSSTCAEYNLLYATVSMGEGSEPSSVKRQSKALLPPSYTGANPTHLPTLSLYQNSTTFQLPVHYLLPLGLQLSLPGAQNI